MKTLSEQFSLGRGTFILLSTTALCLFLLATCTDKSTSPKHDDVEEVSKFLEDLPSWSEFSPLQSSQPETSIGDAEQEPDVIMDVDYVDEHGDVYTEKDVIFSCQVQPYTLTENPEKIAMYSPDRELVWPGAFIQGKSHRDGLGSLLGLPIAERTPIRVSIPALASDDNFRTVDRPNQAEVDQAIGSMIGAATESGLRTPSTISFSMETFHSETQMALGMKVSGRYLKFTASASGSYDRNRSETTVTAQFYQKMFEVVVEPPQSPGDFFSEDFTEARLQQQVNMGRIGPNNLPVYISNVVYGRMMMFSMTSTASEDEIRATLQAGYNTIGKGGNVEMDARHKSILQESKIMVTSIGGDAQATLNMIKSGDWSQYFTENAPLSSAAPLSYTFRNLGDGSIAGVTETTEYNIRTCEARQATPGTFLFLNAQTLGLPISAPVKVMMGDVNGNGLQDLIYNHLSPSSNQTVVLFSNGDGTFNMGGPVSHSAIADYAWSDYEVRVGDFNNNGKADLVWNRVDGSNTTYIALSNGDGTYEEMPMVRAGWTPKDNDWNSKYKFEVGNVDGINGDDLIWNRHFDRNRTYVGLSNGDGTFGVDNFIDTSGKWNDHGTSTGWSQTAHQFAVRDVNGNGRDDLIWYRYRNPEHKVWVAQSSGTQPGSMFSNLYRHERGRIDGFKYELVIGNITGIYGVDLVWVNPKELRVHKDLSNGIRVNFVPGDVQELNDIAESADDYVLRLLDVNGDGRKDLLMNRMGTVNRSFIGLGRSSGNFDFSRVSQDHPDNDQWGQFEILTGDITGDSREDVVYVNADATNTVYVGLSRGSAQ